MHPQNAHDCADLKKLIREVPDFPKQGILFYDITTLLKDKLGFARLIDALTEHYIDKNIDLVLGIEARGFIFGPALAYRLNAGFVPVRKPKKLPAESSAMEIRARVRPRYAGGPQRFDQTGPAHCDLRRPAGDRRHRQGHRRNGEIAGCRNLRAGICGGTGRTEGPRQAERVRRFLAAAL